MKTLSDDKLALEGKLLSQRLYHEQYVDELVQTANEQVEDFGENIENL